MRTSEQGKIIFVDEVRRGVSTKTGESWASLDFVIEVQERFVRRVKFNLFGEKYINTAELKVGDVVEVVYVPESREYNGNWFTDLRCVDVLENNRSRLIENPLMAG